MTLGELRKNKGFTQMELAERIDMKQNVISMWENGRIKPKITHISKLAKALGVTADEILECFNEKEENKNAQKERQADNQI